MATGGIDDCVWWVCEESFLKEEGLIGCREKGCDISYLVHHGGGLQKMCAV